MKERRREKKEKKISIPLFCGEPPFLCAERNKTIIQHFLWLRLFLACNLTGWCFFFFFFLVGNFLPKAVWWKISGLSCGWKIQVSVFTSHHIASHHITLHHITSLHITSLHITLHHITSHNITSHHFTSHHITSHRITHHVTSHRITSHHTRLYYICFVVQARQYRC